MVHPAFVEIRTLLTFWASHHVVGKAVGLGFSMHDSTSCSFFTLFPSFFFASWLLGRWFSLRWFAMIYQWLKPISGWRSSRVQIMLISKKTDICFSFLAFDAKSLVSLRSPRVWNIACRRTCRTSIRSWVVAQVPCFKNTPVKSKH